jgi:hypothetical protein
LSSQSVAVGLKCDRVQISKYPWLVPNKTKKPITNKVLDSKSVEKQVKVPTNP